MAIEIEKKYRLDKKRTEELTVKLGELGAEFLNECREENCLYRGGVLDERNAFLRLRKTGDVALLTYKQSVEYETASDFKHKIEFETVVADADATERIIKMLGYRLSVVYEKDRKSWRLGNVEVVLDELPFGLYMEIEGSIADIVEAEKLLGTEDLDLEEFGYPTLTTKFGVLVGNVWESRFEQPGAA